MKRFWLFCGVVFLVLTFLGAGYVLYRRETVSAGYAAVPMVLALASLAGYRQKKQ